MLNACVLLFIEYGLINVVPSQLVYLSNSEKCGQLSQNDKEIQIKDGVKKSCHITKSTK